MNAIIFAKAIHVAYRLASLDNVFNVNIESLEPNQIVLSKEERLDYWGHNGLITPTIIIEAFEHTFSIEIEFDYDDDALETNRIKFHDAWYKFSETYSRYSSGDFEHFEKTVNNFLQQHRNQLKNI